MAWTEVPRCPSNPSRRAGSSCSWLAAAALIPCVCAVVARVGVVVSQQHARPRRRSLRARAVSDEPCAAVGGRLRSVDFGRAPRSIDRLTPRQCTPDTSDHYSTARARTRALRVAFPISIPSRSSASAASFSLGSSFFVARRRVQALRPNGDDCSTTPPHPNRSRAAWFGQVLGRGGLRRGLSESLAESWLNRDRPKLAPSNQTHDELFKPHTLAKSSKQ